MHAVLYSYLYDSVLVIETSYIYYLETNVKWFVEPCLTNCSFYWSDSYLHDRLFLKFCNLKFKKHPSEQYYSTINSYSKVQRNHGFKRMKRLITSLACFRNILHDFNFTESEIWTDKEHYETVKKYERSLNRTEAEKIILASFPNLTLTRVSRSILATIIVDETDWIVHSLKMVLSLTLYESVEWYWIC